MKIEEFIKERRMLSLGTGHVSPETRDWLNVQSKLVADLGFNPGGPQPSIHILPSVYGWMFYAGAKGDPVEPDWPADLCTIVRTAQDAGCEWVELDCDNSAFDGLPTWEW